MMAHFPMPTDKDGSLGSSTLTHKIPLQRRMRKGRGLPQGGGNSEFFYFGRLPCSFFFYYYFIMPSAWKSETFSVDLTKLIQQVLTLYFYEKIIFSVDYLLCLPRGSLRFIEKAY